MSVMNSYYFTMQKQEDSLKAHNFTDAVIAITYQCNSRCVMCNIWQYKGPAPLPAEEYLKLPSSLRSVNISGGEATLRSDIAQVMANIKKAAPKVRFKISHNGFAPQLFKKRMLEVLEHIDKKDIGIVVSIDGLEQMQEQVRRIPQGFKKNMETIEICRELGLTDITIAFTAGDYNIHQLMDMYELSKKIKTEFTVAALHNSDHYFQIQTNKIDNLGAFRDQFMQLVRAELRSWNLKRWVRAFFAYGVIWYLLRNERILPNYAGKKAFFLDPNGYIYPADVTPKPMGNIKDFTTFQELLDTPDAQKSVALEGEATHWMVCTARTAIQSHPIRVITWILKSKFLPHTLKDPIQKV